MPSDFIPAFEFQDWVYQSFLVTPVAAEWSAAPGTEVTAKKWAMGKLLLSDSPDGYEAKRISRFRSRGATESES